MLSYGALACRKLHYKATDLKWAERKYLYCFEITQGYLHIARGPVSAPLVLVWQALAVISLYVGQLNDS